MSRVLIVSKTRMRGDHVCVGGHDFYESMHSIRLLQPDGTNMPAGTRFDMGQVWDLDYEQATDIRPPHVEDVSSVPTERGPLTRSNTSEHFCERGSPYGPGV